MSDGSEWTSMPVRESTRERVRDLRPESAHSVDEFVNTLLTIYEETQPRFTSNSGDLHLDFEPEEANGPSAEDIASAVVADVRAELPRAVADEVEARLR